MATTWFTADLHLGHANIIRHCLRPFFSAVEEEHALHDPRGRWRISDETVERHDVALLSTLNGMIQSQDTLWIVGDFCWGGADAARKYRDRIHCRNVNLVWGNHDQRNIRPLFGSAIEQGMIGVEGQEVWLNHYPMRSWNKSFHGSWHVYGHVHGRLAHEDAANPWWLTRDVGVDACGYQPVSFAMLRSYMEPRQEAFRKRRAELLSDTSGETPA